MRRQRGFTLVELIVVVAIIGILAAIAVPSYKKQVQRSHRSAVQALMLDIANKEQIYLSTNRQYTGTIADLIPGTLPTDITKFYTVTINPVAGPPPGFSVSAAPINTQADDVCGTLRIDQDGTKTNSAGTYNACW